MRRHCQTIAALLLTLLPRCGVVELGHAPAYVRSGKAAPKKAPRKVPAQRQYPPLLPGTSSEAGC